MTPRTRPAPSEFAGHWDIDPEITYLNHGSFGACPRAVLEAQSRWRRRMERELVRFFVEDLEGALDGARKRLGDFVGCRPKSLAFVPNATTGVATVLDNVELDAGEEILVPRHEYPACLHNVQRKAAEWGARIVVAELPFPVSGPDEIVDAIMARVTDRTRLALVSHVTSSTGMVLPIKRIVSELSARGVETIVDGAHAPGFMALDIHDIGAAWYTANCHKWICSPKGSALLHVRDDKREGFRPLVLSNHAWEERPERDKFLIEFDYVGTNDQTAPLTIPDALDVMGAMLPGGWPAVWQHNRATVLRARDVLCHRLGTPPPVPDEMMGCLATVLLPAHPPELAARLSARPTRHHDALQDALIDRHGIQVPIWSVPGTNKRFVRVSAQLYNSDEQYAYLAEALVEELERERNEA